MTREWQSSLWGRKETIDDRRSERMLVNFHGSRAGEVGVSMDSTGPRLETSKALTSSEFAANRNPIDSTRLDAERGAQPSRLRTETGEMTDSDSSVAIGLHVVDDAGRVGRTAEMLDEALARRGNQPWIGGRRFVPVCKVSYLLRLIFINLSAAYLAGAEQSFGGYLGRSTTMYLRMHLRMDRTEKERVEARVQGSGGGLGRIASSGICGQGVQLAMDSISDCAIGRILLSEAQQQSCTTGEGKRWGDVYCVRRPRQLLIAITCNISCLEVTGLSLNRLRINKNNSDGCIIIAVVIVLLILLCVLVSA